MEEYKSYKLSEVAKLSTGFPFDGSKYSKTGIRVVRGDNVTIGSLRWDSDKLKCWSEPFSRVVEYSLQDGDIVIGMDGSRVGRNRAQVTQSDLPLLLAQRVACIRHNEKSVQDYLYYLIFSERFVDYVKLVQTGTSIPHISLKQIGDFEVRLPSIERQKSICRILKSIDDKIALNNRINHNLEEQAQALYKSWFVDFEPFKDVEFVYSELGMIPKGWRVGHIEELISDTYNGDWGKDEETGAFVKKVFCIRGADIPSIRVGNSGKMPTRFIQEKHFQTKYLKDNDIVVEISGGSPTQSTGRFCRVTEELIRRYDNSLICTNFCKALRPKEGCSIYVSYLWNDLYERGIMFSYENGTTGIKNLDLNGLLSGELIVIPDRKTMSAFSDIVSSLNQQALFNGHESEKLSYQRDTLLPKLMSGEISESFLTC